jgi:hypothetical protein
LAPDAPDGRQFFTRMLEVSMKTLRQSARNVHSQFGEDGIVERVFEVIGTESKTCVEFGAWDGFHLSNTANLWSQKSQKGWHGILIEGNALRFQTLQEKTKGHSVTCINAWVGISGESTLDRILDAHGVDKKKIDLVSIDTDGGDYHILNSLGFKPRVIVCEYNPTIPATTDLFDEDYPNSFGCSAAALCRIANNKGYRLVALTDANCIFVREDLFGAFAEFETSLEKLRIDDYLNFMILSFSGDYVLSRKPYLRTYFPYRGRLSGPHQKVNFLPSILRSPVAIGRRLKNRLIGGQ